MPRIRQQELRRRRKRRKERLREKGIWLKFKKTGSVR